MRLLLKIISGSLSGQQIAIDEGKLFRIGRTAKSDFPTEDGFMSGEHFSVEGAAVWIIRDLKSRNGTRVNGKRVNSAELEEGDKIHAGSTDFEVHLEKLKDESLVSFDKCLLATLPPTIPPSKTNEQIRQ